MKNLKRNFIKLFGIVFCIILLTGCNYQNKIEKISNNMKNINSYTVSVQTEYDISGKKTLNTVTDIDLNNKIAKTKNNVLGNSNDDKFEIYYQYESDKIITYTYGIFGDFYFKQESEYTDEDKIGKLNYIEFLNNLENIEVNKIKSDKKGFKKYNLTIESSYISDLIINFNNVKFLEGDVSITVYTDKNYIREVILISTLIYDTIILITQTLVFQH